MIFIDITDWQIRGTFICINVSSSEKLTKRSSNTVLPLVSFSAEQTLSKVELYFFTLYEIFLKVYSPGCAHDSSGIHFDMEFVCHKTFLLSIFHAIPFIDFSHIKHAQVADVSNIFSFTLISTCTWPENRGNDRILIQFLLENNNNSLLKKIAFLPYTNSLTKRWCDLEFLWICLLYYFIPCYWSCPGNEKT